MSEKEILKKLYEDTMNFFENILVSKEMQSEYDLHNYPHRNFVLSKIKEFKESPSAMLVKTFYENDYLDKNSPRSIIVRRNEQGFITYNILNNSREYESIIEPFRFVSIIKELVEDENIKKEMYTEKDNENAYENELDR